MGGPGSGPRPGQRNRAGTGKSAGVGVKKAVRSGALGANRKYNYSSVGYTKGQTFGRSGLSKFNKQGNYNKGLNARKSRQGKGFKVRR